VHVCVDGWVGGWVSGWVGVGVSVFDTTYVVEVEVPEAPANKDKTGAVAVELQIYMYSQVYRMYVTHMNQIRED